MSTQTTLQDLSLLLGAGADPQALAAYLDGLDAEARIQEVRSLSRRALAALYERCQTAAKMSLAEFLPATVTLGQTAVFAGLNNLPLFRTFEKRFTRTPRQPGIGARRKRSERCLGGPALGEFDETTTARTRQARRADASQRGEQGLDGGFAAAQHRLERIAEHSPQRR